MRSGVNGTPTFFIDGSRHDGSAEELNAAIDLRLRLEAGPQRAAPVSKAMSNR
jgi:hypothetical protein